MFVHTFRTDRAAILHYPVKIGMAFRAVLWVLVFICVQSKHMKIWTGFWIVCFILAFLYSIGSIVMERVAWNIADHVTKGALRVENYILDNKLRTGLGNYFNKSEQIIIKKYPFTSDGFQEFVNDRNDIMKEQRKYLDVIQGVISSYKKSGLKSNSD